MKGPPGVDLLTLAMRIAGLREKDAKQGREDESREMSEDVLPIFSTPRVTTRIKRTKKTILLVRIVLLIAACDTIPKCSDGACLHIPPPPRATSSLP
mmetsp:Transcript_30995/g.75594  ORF Transcript_30995/g.75594 Transcript_30995/m.75594 type:complete len:97 (+) Transcript_30995:1118-1408(+)